MGGKRGVGWKATLGGRYERRLVVWLARRLCIMYPGGEGRDRRAYFTLCSSLSTCGVAGHPITNGIFREKLTIVYLA